MLLKQKSKLRENSWMEEEDITNKTLVEVNSLLETEDKMSLSCNQLNKADSTK